MSSAKCHLTSHAPDQPNDPVTVCRELASDRHEIDDLSDTRLGHEAGDQDRGIREVDLLAGEDVHGRGHSEVPAAVVVQQRAEDAGRIEPRRAEPVDGSVDGDQCRRLEISDQAMVRDEWVAVHGLRSFLRMIQSRLRRSWREPQVEAPPLGGRPRRGRTYARS
jgi:hypothetical protein